MISRVGYLIVLECYGDLRKVKTVEYILSSMSQSVEIDHWLLMLKFGAKFYLRHELYGRLWIFSVVYGLYFCLALEA